MILNENFLREAARDAAKIRLAKSYITESTEFDINTEYDLFISHSFSDKQLVIGLSVLFRSLGYRVYIDWIDDAGLNRKNVTSETARTIKNRIQQSRALAYVCTENISNSKWCPWELGISDGMHGKACILPIMDTDFSGREYLGMYPYLDYSLISGRAKYEFWVCDAKDSSNYMVLNKWLK